MSQENRAEILERYDALLEEGALTQEEYDELKGKLLSEGEEPLEVAFEWAGDSRIVVRILDGSVTYNEAFIKPRSQGTVEFCSEVAKIVEYDLGRPISWTAPKSGTSVKPEPMITTKASAPTMKGNSQNATVTANKGMSNRGKSSKKRTKDRTTDNRISFILKHWYAAFALCAVVLIVAYVMISGNASTSLVNRSSSRQSATSTTGTSGSARKTTGTTTRPKSNASSVSTDSQVNSYLNSPELDTLKTNIKAAGTNLDSIVANGDTSELKLRRSLVWSALREFEALSVPSQCKTMRDYYVYASEDLVHALDYYYDYFTGSKNDGTLANATACVEEATKYLQTAMNEESILR